jgi:hypothetical protein
MYTVYNAVFPLWKLYCSIFIRIYWKWISNVIASCGMPKHRNNFVVFYPNVKYLQHFYKLSFSVTSQAVTKPFKSCSWLTLNITVIEQKLTFKEKICHDVVFCYITFWAIFCHLSCIIKLTTKLQILTHSSSAYFLYCEKNVPINIFLSKDGTYRELMQCHGNWVLAWSRSHIWTHHR